MSKNNSQKAARQRRRTRQKQLVEAGRQAEDQVSSYKQQAMEAMARADRLEAEVSEARRLLGEATNQAAESSRELQSTRLVLEGMRGELEMAAQVVDSARAERDAMSQSLTQVQRELAEAREADSDARSLRDRLRKKSEEIDGLKAQVREAREDLHHLCQATSGRVFDRSKKPEGGDAGAAGGQGG